MATDRWNPFQEMLTLRQAMDRLLEDSFVRPGSALLSGGEGAQDRQGTQTTQGVTGSFPIDLSESDDSFEIRATLPGVRPEDIQLTVHNDTLVIRGQSRYEDERREGQGKRWLVREHRAQSFQRAIGLPAPVDPDRAEAHFEHGMLTLTLPKSEAARPRQIQIRSDSGMKATFDMPAGQARLSQQPSQPHVQTAGEPAHAQQAQPKDQSKAAHDASGDAALRHASDASAAAGNGPARAAGSSGERRSSVRSSRAGKAATASAA